MTPEELEELRLRIEALEAADLKQIADLCAQDVNVHAVAPRLGALGRNCIIHYEAKFQKSIDDLYPAFAGSIQQLKEEILGVCAIRLPIYHANVNAVLTTLVSMNGPEPETMIKAQYLLRRAWGFRTAVANGAELIIENLHHNIAAHGGCPAGIAARLVHVYAALLLESMRRVHNLYSHRLAGWPLAAYNAAGRAQADDENDEDLQMALELSKLIM